MATRRLQGHNKALPATLPHLVAIQRLCEQLGDQRHPDGLAAVLAQFAEVTHADWVAFYSQQQNISSCHAYWVNTSQNDAKVATCLEHIKLPQLAAAASYRLCDLYAQAASTERLLILPLYEREAMIGGILCALNKHTKVSPQQLQQLIAMAACFNLWIVRQQSLFVPGNQQRFVHLIDSNDDMVMELNRTGDIVDCWSSHPICLTPPLKGTPLTKVLPETICPTINKKLCQALAIKQPIQFDVAYATTERLYYFAARIDPLISYQDHAMLRLHDISDIMQRQAQYRNMIQTLDLLEEVVIQLDTKGIIKQLSAGWAKLRAIEPEAIQDEIGQPLLDFVCQENHDALRAIITSMPLSERTVTQRFQLQREHASALWVELKLLVRPQSSPTDTLLQGVLRDISETHLHENHIRQLALHDGLTGLPNRVLLDDLLHQAIARAKRNQTRVGLGFIDLDHFKQINDAFGHRAGDQTLITVAKQLKSVLRDVDVLARWGGDEFVALLPDLSDWEVLESIAERLREVAQQGVVLDGIEARTSISIGIAVFPDDGQNGEELMAAADSTMYHAKAAGRNNVQFYREIVHLKSLSREHIVIQNRLNIAVNNKTLQVFYQPMINARNGQVASIEALARWHDEQKGWISPQIFIPMAERLGLIQALSEQVMLEAICRLKQWRNHGLAQVLALNVSRNQLFSPRLLDNLKQFVSKYELHPNDIEVEITESLALTDQARQSKNLLQLHNAGFRIAIDDFGTGYSSLSQLHEMPIDVLKVDISFTSRLNTAEGRRIMLAIVQMAQALDFEVVVEGVESAPAAKFLRDIGVATLQGFYFSEALPYERCEQIMHSGVDDKLRLLKQSTDIAAQLYFPKH